MLGDTQTKLAAIAAHAQYSNLGSDAAWQQLKLAEGATRGHFGRMIF